MTPLTPLVEAALVRTMSPTDREIVADLLRGQCGRNLPLIGNADAIERIRLAVLRLAGGRSGSVLDHIALAQQDWRDVLMAAGFGHDLETHRRWARQETA